MKRITKPKGLSQNLIGMPVGSTVEITSKDYKATVVRSIVWELNKQGYFFTSTEKGLIDCIRVTRLK